MNLIEITSAFIEGLALIASPCILPVLPLVLGASADGGRKRPLGVIAGFILSFSLFVMVSRQIVAVLGIDLDIIKNISLVLLALFGIVLMSEKLSQKFSEMTQSAASLGSRLSASGNGGFISGMAVGSLIGLVWTPCAGPIMAAVLVQVIRQQTTLSGLAVTVSFAVGASVPMLVIALAGRAIMSKIGWLSSHAAAMRRLFGALILLSAGFIASGADIQSLSTPAATVTAQAGNGLEDGLAEPYPAPEITGIEQWFNSTPLTLSALRGKVVLIDFWTYSCINCVRTLPYIKAWNEKYRKNGLVIIGIHAPEFEFEKKPENVKAAIAEHGITYPVALDNHLSTWTNFNNLYWPAHYLIDKTGKVVYTHFGEGHYDITENNIRYLLGIDDKVAATEDTPSTPTAQTPETYLGYARMESFINKDRVLQDGKKRYAFPAYLPPDDWALSGAWNVGAEQITAAEKNASLRINFTARKVFLVLGTANNNPVEISISLNGKPAGKINVNHHSLYQLIAQDQPKSGMLEVTAADAGLEAYAFTFGE